jgi:hypothetical protein
LIGRPRVVFFGGELQQLARVSQAALEPIQAADSAVELGALFAEFLRPLRLVPNPRLLEFAGYFLEAFVLVVVIKDTSSRNRYAPRDL